MDDSPCNEDHMVDVAQLVRASDCGSEGRGFEPLLPPSRRKKITPQRVKLYVSMIRKVFCFWGIVYSESDCPLLDPAPFVPVREEDANCGRCVGFHRYAFNSSPCCIRSTIPSRAALLRTIISVFLQEAPRFPGRTKHPSVPVSPLRPLPPAEIHIRCQIGPEHRNRSVSDVRRTSGFLTLPGRLRRGCDNTLPG